MKTVYTVAYKPVFADKFDNFRTFSSIKEAKEYIALEKEWIRKACGCYDMDDNFRIIKRLENEPIRI